MSKTKKIVYWVATIWLALGMTSTGIVQIIGMQEELDMITALGYPIYILPLLGTLKLLGVVAILAPRFPLLKEWAYAGFAFTVIGATYSHLVAGDGMTELFGPLLLLVLTTASWYFRPANRKLNT